MKTIIYHFLSILLFTVIFIFSTAESCTSNSGSSNGSGGGTTQIRYDQTYEFSKVSLFYDYSSVGISDNALLSDAIDFQQAHDMPVGSTHGRITNLRNILMNADNYPDSRKPQIKVTIKPSGEPDVIHYCSLNDVGEHEVRNLPNYGSAVNSVIVQVQTITTTNKEIRLCWSKTFDLNQSWWDSLKDKALSGNAEIKVGSYTKSIIDDRMMIVRKVDNEYRVLNYIEEIDEAGIIECDVEISAPPTSPSLSKEIYVDGKFDNRLEWAEPIAVVVLN